MTDEGTITLVAIAMLGTLPLLTTSLGALGLLVWRKVRKPIALADMVHTEAEGGALEALEQRSMRGGYRPRA